MCHFNSLPEEIINKKWDLPFPDLEVDENFTVFYGLSFFLFKQQKIQIKGSIIRLKSKILCDASKDDSGIKKNTGARVYHKG